MYIKYVVCSYIDAIYNMPKLERNVYIMKELLLGEES